MSGKGLSTNDPQTPSY